MREKFLQFDWLRAVVFLLNLKYLHVKITNFFREVVYIKNKGMIFTRGINTTRYFKIVSNFTPPSAGEITYNNFEISLVVFMPNITAKKNRHAITYTNNAASEHYGGYFEFDNSSITIIESKRKY